MTTYKLPVESLCSPQFEDIGEAMVFQVLRVADLLTRIGDSKVFGKELTQAQFNVLMVLRRHGDRAVSQKDILEKLVSTKGNVSIHITNLSRMGYICKKTSKADSRMNEVRLTAKGRRILTILEPMYVEHLREITDDLPRQQIEAALALLKRLQEKCQDTLAVSSATKKGGRT